MGDDFDLFPKRENLDPFSFGKKEKKPDQEKEGDGDDLFGQQEQPADAGTLPDLPLDIPSEPAAPPAEPPPLPDLPLGVPETPAPPAATEPTAPAPPPTTETAVESVDGLLSGGPISEEKTFDEPVFEPEPSVQEPDERGSRKSPSPFVIVGGALIIIIGLLYGALTYLKRDKPPAPAVTAPPAAVSVIPPQPEPAPVPDAGDSSTQSQPPGASGTEPTGETEASTPEAGGAQAEETSSASETPAPEPAPTPEPPPTVATAAGAVKYSVQVGAFILDSSVAELEKKLRGLGYDPVLKKGSTTAMMNMLTVGPFRDAGEARGALSRLKDAGVDSNLRRRNDGSAIINAGSYLLEENATSVMRKVRSMGYPVKMSKREAKLPMTFVRVGQFTGLNEANGMKAELKGKGLDGIVVKQ